MTIGTSLVSGVTSDILQIVCRGKTYLCAGGLLFLNLEKPRSTKWVGGLPGPEVLSLRKHGFFSHFLRWSSGQAAFLHGLNPGSNSGQAPIEEFFKFLAKTGASRGSSPRSPDSESGALPTALRWVIYS